MKSLILIIIFCLFIFNIPALAQQKILFKFTHSPPTKHPTSYFLAGDFNNWNPADSAWKFQQDASGRFILLKNLPKGSYSFKMTRGSWITVECSATGTPIANRAFKLLNDTTITMNVENWQDNFAVPEKQHTASLQVHIISEKFAMPQLDRERRVWIYLPKDYDTKKRYPVIYMQDGQNLFDAYTSGYGEWGVDEIMDKIPDAKAGIIVGIDHGGDYRITEYDPYDSKYGNGRGDDYIEFLVKTLTPFIDRHYKTNADARHTTIAGSSMGGLIAMYAALKYPQVFGNAGIFSPAFWIAPEIYQFASKQVLPTGSSFYFVCGDAESESMVADMQKMAGLITQKIPVSNVSVTIIKGASHNEKQWNSDFQAFYDWLIKK